MSRHGRLLFPLALLAAAAKSANVVLIVSDDLGYNEHNFMNASRGLLTPHLDKLAKEGIVLKDYHVQPICSPSRSALMTGKYPMRLGTQANVIYWDTPWGVPLQHKFMPQYLKEHGDVATALFGKWHLGMFRESYAPWRRGFDRTMGYLQGCGSAWTHESSCCSAGSATSDQSFICNSSDPSGRDPTDYRGYDWFREGKADLSANGTNTAVLIGDAGSDFVREHAASERRRPFFLALTFQNIHEPFTAMQEYVDLYRERQDLTEEEKVIFGYISEMDDAVGKVVKAVREAGLWEETLWVYTSDNGAPGNARNVRGRNYPFQGFKGSIWEGGTRVPAFISGAGIPKALQGSVSHKTYHITDWVPTLWGRIGKAGGTGAFPGTVDGYDIWKSLTEPSTPSPRDGFLYNINPLCHAGQAYPPKAGVRMGPWKLLCFCYNVTGIDGARETGPWLPEDHRGWHFNGAPVLFNLDTDPGETEDLSDAHPDVVKTLLDRLRSYADEMVEPMQWVPPFQGPDYECASCPLRPRTGPYQVWGSWLPDEPTADAIVI